ncbi:MAG: hypothetical protein JKX76_05280 [Colwellia sp.]|nr:hypothetical protein [Colwellia sp.]
MNSFGFLNSIKKIYYKFLYWKGEWQETTANRIIKKLLKRGVSYDDIIVDDIKLVYQSLKACKGSPTKNNMLKVKNYIPHDLEVNVLTDDIIGVIVETRKHSELAMVVNNFFLNTGRKIQIFHGTDNLEFILSSDIKGLITNGVVFLTALNVNQLSEDYYNSILLSEEFWLAVKARNKIIIFQTDSIICSNSNYQLLDFKVFDYIGASWGRRLLPNGIVADGGVGGFSFRDYKKSIDCVRRFPAENWKGGEDDYFSFHIELIGGKVGNKIDCAKFCSQEEFISKSFAAHQISNMTKKERIKFIKYCPDAKFLLP